MEFDGSRYFLDWDRPDSIGKVAHFYGCASNVVRAYMWVKSLGDKDCGSGPHRRAQQQLPDEEGPWTARASVPYAPGHARIEQVRYSRDQMVRDTGVTSQDADAHV